MLSAYLVFYQVLHLHILTLTTAYEIGDAITPILQTRKQSLREVPTLPNASS